MIDIRRAEDKDILALYEFYTHIGKKDDGYFEEALTRAHIFLAYDGDTLCAFCLLNWEPRYRFYRKLGIPEIQDINVLPQFRRRGVATKLIRHCENLAREKGKDHMGISYGLTKDYGPAQILYTRLGYVPDGNGMTCDREYVAAGKSYPINDDLALMLIKELYRSGASDA